MRLRTLTCVAALAAVVPAAQAVLVVDTGTPVDGPPWILNARQWLGATFELAAPTRIFRIDGYIGDAPLRRPDEDEPVKVDIFTGARPEGTPVLSWSTQIEWTGTFAWQSFAGLPLALGAGTYTLSFSTQAPDGFNMTGGAPMSLAQEWARNNGVWYRDDTLDIGVRIDGSVVPEPATFALLLPGIGLLAARRYTFRGRRS